jgi:quercetin dioxygenase-like cupin family protein
MTDPKSLPTAPKPGRLPEGEALALADVVAYAPGAIVSRALTQSKIGSVTVFAFDAGQALSEHAAPFDAHVLVLDGAATVTVGGKPVTARAGDVVLMPANVPHAVDAPERMKMLLVMIRG